MADFGEILRSAGEFGLFQKLVLFALCSPSIIIPLNFGSLLFIQSHPNLHCNTDWILKAAPNLTREERLNLTLPRDPEGSFSRCLMFVPVDRDLDTIREYGLNETVQCQDGWEYDRSMYQATIVTDFNLVCDKAKLAAVGQPVAMAGVLAGSLLFGPFAESFGRKQATQISLALLSLFTVIGGLSPNFPAYLASLFIEGIGGGGFRVTSIVLATEWIAVDKRSLGACLSQIFNAVGNCVLAGTVYFIRDWRLAQFVFVAPMVLVMTYIWFIPESARWLLDRGRTEEVKHLILKAAAINKRTVPESLLEKISAKKTVEQGGIRVLIESPALKKYFLAITLAWFSTVLSQFCLLFNVGNFGLDIFLTQLMFGLTEFPAHILCIWLLEVLGRKYSLTVTLLLGGSLCLASAVPRDQAIAVTVLVLAGRFFLVWGASICNVYIQELFPTSVRQTALGLASVVVRIAGMLSPLLNLLSVYHWSAPTIVFSSTTLLSGALVFLLPETRGTELPDSTPEAEARSSLATPSDCPDAGAVGRRAVDCDCPEQHAWE